MNVKAEIYQRTDYLLEKAVEAIRENIIKAVDCGALNLDDYKPEHDSMILPKIIMIAVLEEEASQYKGKGTRFEKQIKKEVVNLKLFL